MDAINRSVVKRNYLDISYDEKKLPRTAYPGKLAQYLYKNHFKKTGSLLDVGCGRGEFLEQFKDLGFEVHGIDVSPSVEDLNIGFTARCDFEHERFPLEEKSLDFVFSKSVVEHLHHPEKMVNECFRVLKPGGKAIFMCPSWVHTYWGPFYIDHTHVTPFTLPSLNQLLELSGFCVEHSEHFLQLPIVWRFPILKIGVELTARLPIPYRPLYPIKLPESVNKWVRFSKEKMLLVVGVKPT